MRSFIQLVDPISQNAYSIDRKSMLLQIHEGDSLQEVRLRPFHCAVLWGLFEDHPKPVSYAAVKTKLKSYKLACPDVTRLHRKVSEIRTELGKISPNLLETIQNIRGIGYSLPLNWREPSRQEQIQNIEFQDPKLLEILQGFELLIQNTNGLLAQTSIMKRDDFYILDRKPLYQRLEKSIVTFNDLRDQLIKALRTHPANFLTIRIQNQVALLGTYIGLARMCDFSITREQWQDWHKEEVRRVFADLQSWVKQAEN